MVPIKLKFGVIFMDTMPESVHDIVEKLDSIRLVGECIFPDTSNLFQVADYSDFHDDISGSPSWKVTTQIIYLRIWIIELKLILVLLGIHCLLQFHNLRFALLSGLWVKPYTTIFTNTLLRINEVNRIQIKKWKQCFSFSMFSLSSVRILYGLDPPNSVFIAFRHKRRHPWLEFWSRYFSLSWKIKTHLNCLPIWIVILKLI